MHELNFYTDALEVYKDEGYLLAIEYGCCTSTSEFELFDLRGNPIVQSNDFIKSLITENNHYLISALKNEVYDAPILFIQNNKKERQYISFSNISHKMHYEGNFYLKIKNQPLIELNNKSLKQHRLKTIDNIEIWLPFNQNDTLKIPFKNQKAFGIDYPQIELQLVTEE